MRKYKMMHEKRRKTINYCRRRPQDGQTHFNPAQDNAEVQNDA